MVGIVPRSAKLMELTGLFSGEAKGLIGRGVGTPAFEGTPVGHAGGMCAHHTGSRPRISCSKSTGPRFFPLPRPCPSPCPARFGILENPAIRDLRIPTTGRSL